MTQTQQTAQHTPGPWTHKDGEVLSETQSAVIAQVMGGDDFPCCDEDIDAECKANARLIAAAPELLEACKEAEGVLTEPGMMDVDEWKAWQKRVVVALRAAIAKATT